VDGVRSRRQAGSTLKPFLYALAFEKSYLTPVTLLNDSPLDLALSTGIYRPKNHDREFHGPVEARIALGSSLNVPAVRLISLLGADSLWERLNRLGFAELRPAADYGPSLALGTADVSLWELVGAYLALANDGRFSPLRLFPGRLPEEGPSAGRAFSQEASRQVTEILADRDARSLGFGWESPLDPAIPAAVKTGTSKDMRDNWCIGYTRKYTVGVWVGNLDGAPMHDVSGTTGAAPAWAAIVRGLHPSRTARAFLPSIWSGTGTRPTQVDQRHGTPRIRYPVDGMRIAWDPEIPAEAQRVRFVADGERAVQWNLDGVAVSQDWSPSGQGSHKLAWLAPDGRILDQIRFTVSDPLSEGLEPEQTPDSAALLTPGLNVQ
jgi:penicillin-binding protein 1C